MPDIAAIKLETRGATTEIDEYMVTEAKRILNACAAMYDVKVKNHHGRGCTCLLCRQGAGP